MSSPSRQSPVPDLEALRQDRMGSRRDHSAAASVRIEWRVVHGDSVLRGLSPLGSGLSVESAGVARTRQGRQPNPCVGLRSVGRNEPSDRSASCLAAGGPAAQRPQRLGRRDRVPWFQPVRGDVLARAPHRRERVLSERTRKGGHGAGNRASIGIDILLRSGCSPSSMKVRDVHCKLAPAAPVDQ